MMFCSDFALDEGHVYVVLGEGEEPVEDVQSALTRYICDDVPAEAVPLLAVLGHVLLVVYRLHGLGLGHDRGAAQPVAALVLRLPLRHRPQRVRAEVAAARPGHGLVMVLTLQITDHLWPAMPGMESPLAMPAITWLGVMEALAGSTEVFLSANKSDMENL